MAGRKVVSLGVDWFLPGRKRRFATTTVATSSLIELLAEEGGTVSETLARINFDDEAKAVLAVFVEHGLGDEQMSAVLRPGT